MWRIARDNSNFEKISLPGVSSDMSFTGKSRVYFPNLIVVFAKNDGKFDLGLKFPTSGPLKGTLMKEMFVWLPQLTTDDICFQF
jgi:hypothetical protein